MSDSTSIQHAHHNTYTRQEKTMPTQKTNRIEARRRMTGISCGKAPLSRQPVRLLAARSKSTQRVAVQTLRLKAQRLLRNTRQFSKSQRDECYRKVATLPLAKQRTFWVGLAAILKRGAAKAVGVCIAVYKNHWNSLLWAAAGLSLGWLFEAMLTIQLPFVGTVRLLHWAWKWLCAAAGAAYGIWFDHDYRMKTATVSFA
jgi:hypothetical protein